MARPLVQVTNRQRLALPPDARKDIKAERVLVSVELAQHSETHLEVRSPVSQMTWLPP
jgi:hypothetical protein